MTARFTLHALLVALLTVSCTTALAQYPQQTQQYQPQPGQQYRQPANQYQQPAGPQRPTYNPAQPTTQPQGNYQRSPGQTMPRGASAIVPQNTPTLQRRQTQPVNPPFRLTPAEQAEVDSVLKKWEEASRTHKRIAIEFFRFEFKPAHDPNKPLFIDQGEADFTSEGKWYWHILGEYKNQKLIEGQREEKMICDGKSVYLYDYSQQTVNQQILAPDVKGQDMVRAMLPFMFGTDKNDLKKRYLIRLLKFSGLPEGYVCIDAWPRFLDEAKNYQSARMILDMSKMEPTGLMLILPNGKDSYKYQFTKVDINPGNPLNKLFSDPFKAKIPSGWKTHVEQMSGPEVANQPAAGPVRQ